MKLNNLRSISGVLFLSICCLAGCRDTKPVPNAHLSRFVNPFIGASTSVSAAGAYHGLGKTFPGATVPYGMVQVSPNTISGGDNSSGYSYEHQTIEGFALTQMSGVGWFGELGNFLVMPTTGELQIVAGKEDGSVKGYRSVYSKKFEQATAGYYATELTDYGIKVETSATPHCGILRFTYPQSSQSRLQVDLARRVGGTSQCQKVEIVDDKHFRGWIKCTPAEGGWGNGEGNVSYTLHFYAEVSKPLANYGFWSADIPDEWVRKRDEAQSVEYLRRVAQAKVVRGEKQMEGKHLGIFSEFSTEKNEEVILKVGISFVDQEGAKRNFDKEIARANFDEIKKEATCLWDQYLADITVEGATDADRTIFYTALYHTMIDPRIYTDVDGRYIGGDGQIYQADGFTKRTVFSGWDVFRTQFPLQTIINPQLVDDMLNSLITLADQSGRHYFERWELLNSYSGCMLGNPALSVLTDAYMKGIRNYDVEKAYQYALNTSDKFSPVDKGFDTSGICISNTLEYAYDDWCLAQLAKVLGKSEDEQELLRRSQFYRNIFDPQVGWFRPRNEDGSWQSWDHESMTKEFFGCMECNPLQQGWFVPHDLDGLTSLIGGRDSTLTMLNDFFQHTPTDLLWNKYYNHANEPVHHVPFLFNRLGAPWLTQQWSRFICTHAYFNSVEGLVGNEDAGQMSAWYVMAASGIYPVCPGSTRYEISSPVFDKVTYKVPASGKTFTVVAHNNSIENIYIQRALLNGKEYNKCYLDHADILAGSVLELFMGDKPNKQWGLDE